MTTDDIIQRIQALQEKWANIRDRAYQYQAQWQNTLPSEAPEVVDETLEVLVKISQRIGQTTNGRAFRLAMASASQQLMAAEAELANISNSHQWNRFPAFLSYLSQATSAIYGIYILTSQEGRDAVKEACIQLNDELTHLKALHEELEEIKKHASELERTLQQSVSQAGTHETTAKTSAENSEKSSEAAEGFKNSAETASREAQTHKQTITELAQQAEQLKKDIPKSQQKLETLTKDAESIRETLEKLLPGATSASLAYAYNQNKAAIEKRMQWLFWQFLGGLIVLLATLVISHHYLGDLPSDPVALMLQLLTRGMLAAPAIWFTWVVARQYAYLSRLHTDYGFKEAMATSFEGFRRMMEELDENDHKELTAALSVKAIEIIGSDPDRLNASHHGDESPFVFMWRSLMGRMFPNQGKKDNES